MLDYPICMLFIRYITNVCVCSGVGHSFVSVKMCKMSSYFPQYKGIDFQSCDWCPVALAALLKVTVTAQGSVHLLTVVKSPWCMYTNSLLLKMAIHYFIDIGLVM